MVLGSAQYKRQQDDHEESASISSSPGGALRLEDSGGGGGGGVATAAAFSSTSPPPSAVGGDLHTSSSTSTLGGGGGHVRLVDSTIRYHLGGTSYWHGRSGLEKVLLVVTAALAFSCTVMLMLISSSSINGGDYLHVTAGRHDMCLSQECVKVAAAIISAADFDKNPCEDFYAYSCGGWERSNPIPDGKTGWSMFEKLTEANQLVMKNALDRAREEREQKKDAAPEGARQKLLAYYEACLDLNGTVEDREGRPLVNLLRDPRVGGWKVMEMATDDEVLPDVLDRKSFQSKLEYLQHQYQTLGFFSWSVGEDDKNSSRHIIQITQGGLSLPTREYYLPTNDSDSNFPAVVAAFKDMIVEVAALLAEDGDDGNNNNNNNKDEDESGFALNEAARRRMKAAAEGVVALETRLAEVTIPLSQMRATEDDQYHNMTLTELGKLAPFLDWTEFFSSAFAEVGRKVDEDQMVVVYAPSYLGNLSAIVDEYLNNGTETQLALDNYMVMKLVALMRSALSQKYRDAGKSFQKALLGKETHRERWRECVADADAVLGFALAADFVRDAFGDDGHEMALASRMLDAIKEAFVHKLEAAEWMDEETRELALYKARAIQDMIGYPEYILDDSALDEKYSNLTVTPDEYFDNNLRYHNYSQRENLLRLDAPVNRTKWSMTPPTVNAYYAPSKNQIAIPAGLLRVPFFRAAQPPALNFGAIGVVMGHELSHAFDDQGRRYDAGGDMVDWWNNATEAEFEARSGCMRRQYSGYGLRSANVSGQQTLGENIADNGGLSAAYHAYRGWAGKDGGDKRDWPPLPGLEHLSNQQLFFLSFAQVWCSVSTPQTKRLQIMDDPHSPARFRVIGALSNSYEFSEAFSCPANSPMNPAKKCQVW